MTTVQPFIVDHSTTIHYLQGICVFHKESFPQTYLKQMNNENDYEYIIIICTQRSTEVKEYVIYHFSG